jgi:hypothetical protein
MLNYPVRRIDRAVLDMVMVRELIPHHPPRTNACNSYTPGLPGLVQSNSSSPTVSGCRGTFPRLPLSVCLFTCPLLVGIMGVRAAGSGHAMLGEPRAEHRMV